ncbi:hypothetical protein CCAX7_14900 [Capsulimonas corticalis]|uniref:Uncharacterized protein n=1 Tax=Capsulimonas corticalis TaxID=2219043 RepID=A0A402CZB3_9BACT|nr:hypothetical protein [Capsulimonas corticalis]BDI29439.1 hypothetical protein CCAX7_14900 [Capsulimonas corticalis]
MRISVTIDETHYTPKSYRDWLNVHAVAEKGFAFDEEVKKIRSIADRIPRSETSPDSRQDGDSPQLAMLMEKTARAIPMPADGEKAFQYIERALTASRRAMTLNEIMTEIIRAGWKSNAVKPQGTVKTALKGYPHLFVQISGKWHLVEWNGTPPKG